MSKFINYLNESGMKDIKKLIKKYKTFEIYFHVDLDGVCSGLGMKQYLQNYGLKIVDAHTIQYGSAEYAIKKGRPDSMKVLVDFAGGKTIMHIHTDHHDTQRGVEKGISTSFISAPSNAGFISSVISPRDLFPPADLKIINMVDSADFLKHGVTPDDVMNAVFKVKPDLPVSKNKQMMGLVVNKLLLAFKNKKGFLRELLLKANPSLVSLYTNIVEIAKREGYKPPGELQKSGDEYVSAQKEKAKGQGKLSDVKNLKNGESVLIDNILIQYGGGYMSKGGYDRYTPFKNNPEADFLCIAWPMGLVQLSMNPFKPKQTNLSMGDVLLKKVLGKYKSKLQNTDITLDFIKWTFENDKNFTDESMGFTFKELLALFDPSQIKGVDVEATFGKKLSWKQLIEQLMDTPNSKLSRKQQELLKRIKISAWDVIMSGSGGHTAISNMSGLSLLGKGYIDFIHQIQYDVAKEMQKLLK